MINLDLYLITTEVPQMGRSHIDVARAGIAGGASVIQFREKGKDNQTIYEIACKIRELTRKAGIPFIVNDRVDIALAVDADGVHVGQKDMPAAAVSSLIGKVKIVGASVSSIEEAVRAEREGASYLGVGPIFPTPSKSDAGEPIGCEMLAQIRKSVSIPLVAIGGINLNNVEDVFKAGADGIAVISAVACAPDMEQAVKELLKKFKELKCSKNRKE
ncbi:thiamine-phosphate pyrophosphorylase [Candidatus Hakubella thermalkaliphila]|uniref:Thiamine-phosphate synthase n=1 Tax=Candidatus Hakubella thermalkaliphila TaxID=2754717 RepID=A0A6V8P6E0_9ACTN|nr:thiamine phosphate synthase [Candidatus Hakubella thermalkaliphila]GFP25081.1 thiamine-phosphate pyrophosphorylase [Candidatus Hakubella thermalkaliphila]GFP27897.1 thiamine-phosphate pyrophosphorylase [Candidatus Hakubella thermalkaliphila]GFP34474.1 thiamine-phosphate pyrophosphorylase [Candidatus Hakubella thermalkaliphila]